MYNLYIGTVLPTGSVTTGLAGYIFHHLLWWDRSPQITGRLYEDPVGTRNSGVWSHGCCPWVEGQKLYSQLKLTKQNKPIFQVNFNLLNVRLCQGQGFKIGLEKYFLKKLYDIDTHCLDQNSVKLRQISFLFQIVF